MSQTFTITLSKEELDELIRCLREYYSDRKYQLNDVQNSLVVSLITTMKVVEDE